ncbi:hypothetical protein GCM10008995_07910 [Halobellus salinus]|uniref:t-SNARE coiled-coil homology domain-containing protein n=1 Tax=Halobellus salinus TaxID=931585 RepID=A0A830EQK9_9EURY|nr:hypothetical protein [Halobellus salinus]GGJ00490.1 hypothetical protein GCM10008995_07910 [Halobellus salinus]SMP01458.1 hypothetical protein SAMN06265347_101116 [Halobellus salinus]
MSHESDVDRTVSVSDGDVRVEKSFARNEFPVPAIKFRLVSESDDSVHVRLVDRIPEDLPMESVGFHPEYGSDNWIAYKNHRVEYERTLEPGESATTVYGIRLEDPSDAAGFLGEPVLERPPVPGEPPEDRAGTDVDDILGADRSQLVRDALQGNGRLANQEPPAGPADAGPGVKPISGPSADGNGESPDGEPDPIDGNAEPAVEPAGKPTADADDTEVAGGDDSPEPRAITSELPAAVRRETDSVTPVGSGGVAADIETDADADEYVDIGAEAGDSAGAAAPALDVEAGLAAALAAEIRAGAVSDADLDTLRGELDPGLPRSADVRIRRLQSQLADLEAYSDAIKEFIDDTGTGAELVERLNAEVESVTTELDGLRDGLDAAAEDREAIRDDVGALGDDLAATDDRVDTVDETATTAANGVDDVHDRADAIEDHFDGVESDIDDLTDDIDDLTDDIDDVAAEIGDVAAGLDDTDDYVARVDDDLDEVREEVSAVDAGVADVRESVSADVADLRAEVTALTDALQRVDNIEAEIEELQTFRDRLNSAFGPGGGGSDGGDGSGT